MSISYNVDKSFDFIIDEKPGNAFLALRKIAWGDSVEHRIELRKWFVNSEGEESPGKGATFMTEEGPHELTKVLVEQGFGHTEDILNALKTREDFKTEFDNLSNKSNNKKNLYDPRKVIGL